MGGSVFVQPQHEARPNAGSVGSIEGAFLPRGSGGDPAVGELFADGGSSGAAHPGQCGPNRQRADQHLPHQVHETGRVFVFFLGGGRPDLVFSSPKTWSTSILAFWRIPRRWKKSNRRRARKASGSGPKLRPGLRLGGLFLSCRGFCRRAQIRRP